MLLSKRKRMVVLIFSLSILVVTLFSLTPLNLTKSQQSTNFCIKERCVSGNTSIHWDAMLNYAGKYKLANCAIQKSLSTLTMAIMCYLHDETRFEAMNRTIPGENWDNRLCVYNNTGILPNVTLLHHPQWTHMAVVREPVERFLSGWMDKCHNAMDSNPRLLNDSTWCHGCRKDIACFVQRNYMWLLKFNYTQPYKIFNLEDHFWPQHWFCGFNDHINDYRILKFSNNASVIEKMFDDLKKILLKQNVSVSLAEKIVSQAKGKRSYHATTGRNSTEYYKKLLLSDNNAMRTLVKTYYYDFVEFSFPFPQISLWSGE